jgi:hypothetical protein
LKVWCPLEEVVERLPMMLNRIETDVVMILSVVIRG